MLTPRKMLDLPRAERSALFAKIHLSSEYVFDVLEAPALARIRGIIHTNGGVWLEGYRYPGVYFQATYPDQTSKRRADETMVLMMNEDTRLYFATYWPDASQEEIEESLYTVTGWVRVCVVPVVAYEVDNWINPQRRLTTYEGPHGLKWEEDKDGMFVYVDEPASKTIAIDRDGDPMED